MPPVGSCGLTDATCAAGSSGCGADGAAGRDDKRDSGSGGERPGASDGSLPVIPADVPGGLDNGSGVGNGGDAADGDGCDGVCATVLACGGCVAKY